MLLLIRHASSRTEHRPASFGAISVRELYGDIATVLQAELSGVNHAAAEARLYPNNDPDFANWSQNKRRLATLLESFLSALCGLAPNDILDGHPTSKTGAAVESIHPM